MWLLCGEQTVGRQGMSEDHSGNADVWGEGRWRGWLREGGVSLKAEPVPFAGGADGCEEGRKGRIQHNSSYESGLSNWVKW